MSLTNVTGNHLSMAQVVAGLKTKSSKIRALAKAGYARADIARYLDIRYQHVRNVLVQSENAADSNKTPQSADVANTGLWALIGPDGRVVIPASFRQKMGVPNGGHVFIEFEDGVLKLVGRDEAVRQVQALVTKRVPSTVNMADELIATRRGEASSED